MPKRTDIHKILVIGSGPIVIGQAAEFDYAGTQACLALKEEGYEVVLCNSNPATIMTDTAIADKVYMEPLTLEYIAKIIRYERPDAILPGIGGQTGLNLGVPLLRRLRTVSFLRNSANLWGSLSCPRKSRTAWRKDSARRGRSDSRSCCAPHLRWAEQAAALHRMKKISLPS